MQINRKYIAYISGALTAISIWLAQPEPGKMNIYDAQYRSYIVRDTPANRQASIDQGFTIGSMPWNDNYILFASVCSLPLIWIIGWALIRQTVKETRNVVRAWKDEG